MLTPSGITSTQQKVWESGLAKSHTVKTVIQILKTDHTLVQQLPAKMLLDGQVDGQVVEVDKREKLADVNDLIVLHTLSISLMDPDHQLNFDSDSPADGAVYLDRMVRVIYSTFMPALGFWVDCPLFTGPITDLERASNGYEVRLEAQSKERLASGSVDVAKTYSGQKTQTCKDLLKLTGEIDKYIDFPTATSSTQNVVLVRESNAWSKVYALGSSMSRGVYYDGRGIARMAYAKSKVVFSFTGDNVTEFPNSHPSTSELYNAVRVRAGTTSGNKSSIDVTVYADDLFPTNPNTGTKLGRNGKKLNLVKLIDDSDIKKAADAKTRATDELTESIRTSNGIQLAAFNIPHLELWDLTDVSVDNFYGELRVMSFSKSIVAPTMTVGYTFPVSGASLSKIGR